MSRRYWVLAVGFLVACAGTRSTGARSIEAVGEVATGFTAGTTGFEFVFFPDEGQPVAGMHLVERDSAQRLYELTDARPRQRLRVKLTGEVERATVHMAEEPPSKLGRIRVRSYEIIESEEP